jgi:hypothetical protein
MIHSTNIMSCLYFETQLFGDWILSPSLLYLKSETESSLPNIVF